VGADVTPSTTRFGGRRLVVTGAASGIGAGVAEAAARRGDAVVMADLNATALAEVAGTLRDQGLTVHDVPTDVTDATSVRSLFERAATELGGLDGLVNSAGGFPRARTVEELGDEEWRAVVDLNLFGTFACCRAAIPLLRAAGGGRIVNVASEAGRMPAWETGVHYVASKAGVIGLTKHLARELGRDGITVNAVAPGTTMTPRVRSIYSTDRVEELTRLTPLGRLAELDDQVPPIMFLLSDDSKYITGATLDVNGGRIMI
jgi:NAD(P)-dependent dehydrogenase (short-subunit alcohol dehydrogenase family)